MYLPWGPDSLWPDTQDLNVPHITPTTGSGNRRYSVLVSALAATLLLAAGSGCGQKGPLYLPQETAAANQPANGDCPDKRCRAQAPQENPDNP